MVKDRLKGLLKAKRNLHRSCPDDLKPQFEKYGVIGIIHAAFQQHEADLRSKTKFINVKMQSALAQLGLDQFFAPTLAKFLEYRLKKEQLDAKYLEQLKVVTTILPLGDPLPTENQQVLDVDARPARYACTFYELTGFSYLRESSRMVTFDHLRSLARYPICDKLTGVLASNLVDRKDLGGLEDKASQEEKDVLAVILLHNVLDLQASQDGRAKKLLQEGQKLAGSINGTIEGYQDTKVKFASELEIFRVAQQCHP
jgi:hypothetical protein